jgi:phospholipase/carboxylesterase
MTQPTHAHRLIAGIDPVKSPLVLLHGPGGDEHELVPLAHELAPGSPIIGLRGTVAIDDGYAFFNRFADRSIDEVDINVRTPVLAEFINATMISYSVARAPIAIGFSNGAIMASALLLTRPSLLAGAVLFRPLSPFTDDLPMRLDGIPVLIIDGAKDSRRSPNDGARLAERLRGAGATVTHHVLPVGHSITSMDRQIASEWIGKLNSTVA